MKNVCVALEYIYQNLLKNNWEIYYLNINYKNADAIKLGPNLIELLILKSNFLSGTTIIQKLILCL